MSRQLYKDKYRPELTPIDKTELYILMGLLLYTSIQKSDHKRLSSLFCDERKRGGHAYIRFDDKTSREERKKEYPLAAVSEIFNLFFKICQVNYCCCDNVCLDEMFVGISGNCKIKKYCKPNTYGLKVMNLTKGTDGFSLTSEDKNKSIPSQAVLRLIKTLRWIEI